MHGQGVSGIYKRGLDSRLLREHAGMTTDWLGANGEITFRHEYAQVQVTRYELK